MNYKKKLIEVALPLEAINAASAREKSIRHGHPSTLHLWWARRPLAAARAVIVAQMVDDPSGHPDLFPTEKAQEKERQRLFRIIEDLVKWENTTNEQVLQRARDEIWQSWRYTCAENADHPRAKELFDRYRLPAFHDPFAGGGSLPLEAQRLGLEAYASDLNPVAVLINKAMIEIPPRFAGRPPVHPRGPGAGESGTDQGELFKREWKGAEGLAEDVRYYGRWMRDEAERRIGHLYPKIEVTAEMVEDPDNPRPDLKKYVGQKLTVIAWLWARTVKSPNPAFADVDVPLASTFMLSTKSEKVAYIEPVIAEAGYHFTVRVGRPTEMERAKNGTKLARANFVCLMSNTPISGDYIKAEAKAHRMGSRLMSIVAEGERERVYLTPNSAMEKIALTAIPTWRPEGDIPTRMTGGNCTPYGLTTWGDLFTPRQLVALTTFSDLVQEANERVRADALGARASRPRSAWHRTHLPHFEAGETAQHITFRLHDSLPANVLAAWESELRAISDEHQREAQRRRRIEEALDQGHGACWLRRPEIAQLVAAALGHFDGTRYRLHAWVVMPNHVHVLITPLHGNSLSSIVQSWKSFTAKQANGLLQRDGMFWQADYFDRYIRNEEHFERALAYIGENPCKAGLCSRPGEWAWGSAGVRDARAGRPRSQDDVSFAAGGDGAAAYADAVVTYLGIAMSRFADRNNALCTWDSGPTGTRSSTGGSARTASLRNLFARQAIPMAWDFGEANPFSDSGGGYSSALDWLEPAVRALIGTGCGSSFREDAQSQFISRDKVVSTDPPYYDNIGYADLSDFFYVWLRRSLKPIFPDLFLTLAVPKTEELVATPYRHGTRAKAETFFLDGMTQAMRRLAEQAHPAFPVTIYYAFKQAESDGADGTKNTGWDTFLAAVIEAGFAITGTWPMRTELGNRMIGSGTNALASSIVLVCRQRPLNAPTATRREFLAALKAELPSALRHLQGLGTRASRPRLGEGGTPSFPGIAPVDLAQAAIGPGMAVYTRYAKVLDAEGNPLPVRAALALINQTLDEALAEQEGDFDADSRWALAWFEQMGFNDGEFGVANVLAQAKNTGMDGLVEAGLIVSGKGKVRLLRPDELPAGWDPSTDKRLTVWEMVHQLIRVLESGGEGAAAALAARLGSKAETARELCYRLYVLSDRKKRATDAMAYNGLVQSWPEITRLAQSAPRAATPGTGDLFDDDGGQ